MSRDFLRFATLPQLDLIEARRPSFQDPGFGDRDSQLEYMDSLVSIQDLLHVSVFTDAVVIFSFLFQAEDLHHSILACLVPRYPCSSFASGRDTGTSATTAHTSNTGLGLRLQATVQFPSHLESPSTRRHGTCRVMLYGVSQLSGCNGDRQPLTGRIPSQSLYLTVPETSGLPP